MYRSALKAVKPSQFPANITQLNPKKAVRMTIKMVNNGLFIGLRRSAGESASVSLIYRTDSEPSKTPPGPRTRPIGRAGRP